MSLGACLGGPLLGTLCHGLPRILFPQHGGQGHYEHPHPQAKQGGPQPRPDPVPSSFQSYKHREWRRLSSEAPGTTPPCGF